MLDFTTSTTTRSKNYYAYIGHGDDGTFDYSIVLMAGNFDEIFSGVTSTLEEAKMIIVEKLKELNTE